MKTGSRVWEPRKNKPRFVIDFLKLLLKIIKDQNSKSKTNKQNLVFLTIKKSVIRSIINNLKSDSQLSKKFALFAPMNTL